MNSRLLAEKPGDGEVWVRTSFAQGEQLVTESVKKSLNTQVKS